MKKIISMLFAVAMVFGFISNANAAKTLKCQTVLNTKADEVKMLKDFTDTVTTLTGGSLKFEIMPAGAVVGVKETLDAVDKGLIDCGFAWTHYWSGDHPAAMLFGSPVSKAIFFSYLEITTAMIITSVKIFCFWNTKFLSSILKFI